MRRLWIIRIADIVAKGTLALGLIFSGLYVAAQVDRHVASASAIAAFDEARQEALAAQPDQSLWSKGRQSGYRESLLADLDAPSGLLTIPSIDLTVPVFEGTSELVLNRGIGRIENTADLGSQGNIGLAGHRDGFFRGLKDLKVGEAIEVTTIDGAQRYRVTDLMILDPTDVFVLDPTPMPSVTLVTCYPFYFVGNAPQRFVVRGVLDESGKLESSRGSQN